MSETLVLELWASTKACRLKLAQQQNLRNAWIPKPYRRIPVPVTNQDIPQSVPFSAPSQYHPSNSHFRHFSSSSRLRTTQVFHRNANLRPDDRPTAQFQHRRRTPHRTRSLHSRPINTHLPHPFRPRGPQAHLSHPFRRAFLPAPYSPRTCYGSQRGLFPRWV